MGEIEEEEEEEEEEESRIQDTKIVPCLCFD